MPGRQILANLLDYVIEEKLDHLSISTSQLSSAKIKASTVTIAHTNTTLTSNLVDVLQRQAEGLVSRARGRLDGIKSFQESGT